MFGAQSVLLQAAWFPWEASWLTPMYRQIAEDLRRQIEDGDLQPGAQLRTDLELREIYNASRNTIRDAIKWLITRDLVETRPGQGTFVLETTVPFLNSLTGDPTVASGGDGASYRLEAQTRFRTASETLPQVGIEEANERMAAELEIPGGASVVSRHQQRYIDGTPWSLQTSFYPMDLVQVGAVRLIQAGDITEGTVEYLRESAGHPAGGLPRHDHGTGSGHERDRVLPAAR